MRGHCRGDTGAAVLDGEIARLDFDGRPQVYELMRRRQGAYLLRVRYSLAEWLESSQQATPRSQGHPYVTAATR